MTERDRLRRHPAEVAPLLLGAVLISEVGGSPVVVRLAEVEAYAGVGEDPGSHAHRRRTERNAAMFGAAGHAYVYFTYGMHWCLNVVAHADGRAGAVLLRAGTVTAGEAVARARRPSARSDRELARGPARLTAALGVDGTLDGVDLLDPTSPLRLTRLGGPPDLGSRDEPVGPEQTIRIGPRTGVAGDGAATPWRFWLEGEPTVSRHRPAAPRRR